jgi:invasion protein IalB
MTMRRCAISRQVPLRAAAGIAGLIALTLAAGPAGAADPKLLGNHKDWAAYSFEEGGKKVCYVSSMPKSSDPKGAKRGAIYTLITHRPAENANNVVSVALGYPLRKGSEVTVEIEKKSFALFTDGETGWARDTDTDKALVQALRGGGKLVVKGVSQRGTKTTDTYSLAGAGEALGAIGDACGVKH